MLSRSEKYKDLAKKLKEEKSYDEYSSSIQYFEDFLTGSEDLKHLGVLKELLYQYNHRLTDAKLLNELRSITGTKGDLDLKAEVKRMANYGKGLMLACKDKVDHKYCCNNMCKGYEPVNDRECCLMCWFDYFVRKGNEK